MTATTDGARSKYAGIGSKKTPVSVFTSMVWIAHRMAKAGWVLRSGHADGADMAFEKSCDRVALDYGNPCVPFSMKVRKEIFLPWPGFNGSDSIFTDPTPEAFKLAQEIHPNWGMCDDAARRLHARNCHQILGYELNDPVKFVACWTAKGKAVGGTRTAIVLAQEMGIPVHNLYTDPPSIILRYL